MNNQPIEATADELEIEALAAFNRWYLDYSRNLSSGHDLEVARAAWNAGRQYERGD